MTIILSHLLQKSDNKLIKIQTIPELEFEYDE